MARITLYIILIWIISGAELSAKMKVTGVQPTSWWIGLKNPRVMLLVSGEDISNATPKLKQNSAIIRHSFPGIHSDYLFIEIEITPDAKTGILEIELVNKEKKSTTIEFPLYNRPQWTPKSLTTSDVIYQIATDRFYNGNTSNDNPQEYFERMDKLNPAGVHGGDFAGIIQLADYLDTLGITAIETGTVFETNQFVNSYERMGTTDFFALDNRLGTMSEYKELITRLHEKQIKTILTVQLNQIGKQNKLAQQPPGNSWIYPDQYKYKETCLNTSYYDPYASTEDIYRFCKQWPDLDIASLNQQEPLVQQYLTQCCIWWLLTTEADVLKIEQSYTNDIQLIKELKQTLSNEFPGIDIITDIPTTEPSLINYYTPLWKNDTTIHIKTYDYPLTHIISNCFSSYTPTKEGLINLYNLLAHDFTYNNPSNNIISADNNNQPRAFTCADKEMKEFKMMLSLLFTLRGTPMILYGTEFLIDGDIKKGKGSIRKDFPAETALGTSNLNTGINIDPNEFAAYNMIKSLINWRKKCPAAIHGNFTHYYPVDDLYLFFREKGESKIMVLINNDQNTKKRFDPTLYSSKLSTIKSATEVISKQKYEQLDNIIIEPKTVMIFELTTN